jgi:hypothetical protein
LRRGLLRFGRTERKRFENKIKEKKMAIDHNYGRDKDVGENWGRQKNK